MPTNFKTTNIMNLRHLFFAAALCIATPAMQALTIEDYCDIKVNAPSTIKEMRPMADGVSYLAIGENGKTINVYSYKTGQKTSTLFDVDAIKGDVKIEEFDGYQISENEKKILLWNESEGLYRHSFFAEFYVYDIMRQTMKRVSEGGKQRCATLSHDGRKVAFVRDNNIYISNLEYETEIAVTKDGKTNEIINGAPDWGYEEEFGIENTIRWSNDDNKLAFIRFDESQVPMFEFDVYSGYCNPKSEYELYPGQFEYKYPLAGFNNAVVSANVYDVNYKTIKKMDLPMVETDYIPSMEFGGTSDRLIIMVLNRDQNNLKIYNVNPASTVAKLIYTESSNAWLSPSAYQMVTYNQNDFVMGSDKSGYRHLYQIDYNGNVLRQLTKGEYYVTAYYGYNAKTNEHYFQSTQLGAINRNVAKVNAKGVVTLLNPVEGTESASFSSNFNYYVRTYSNATTPNQYTLWNGSKKIADIELNASYAERYTNAPKKEFLKVKNAAGQEMDAFIIKPADFDASKKYPLLTYQYNGPESQEVLNKWKMDGIYYFADQGYIVACVDGRGTGCKSRSWSDAVYKQLGKYETMDQVAGAKYFASLPYVDEQRVACFGWSYGGYMTLMELSAENTPFKAGISMAPVTDWRYYDSIYTERYMLRPEQNESGYEISSTLNKTDNMNAKLLIMSGTADDNVHISNTFMYTSKLTAEGKIFDMMAYNGYDHSLRMCNARVQLYKKIMDFLNTRLK